MECVHTDHCIPSISECMHDMIYNSLRCPIRCCFYEKLESLVSTKESSIVYSCPLYWIHLHSSSNYNNTAVSKGLTVSLLAPKFNNISTAGTASAMAAYIRGQQPLSSSSFSGALGPSFCKKASQ